MWKPASFLLCYPFKARQKHVKLRLKELRSYHNSYLRKKNGIISELVDVLAGRVPKSVFVRHYLR